MFAILQYCFTLGQDNLPFFGYAWVAMSKTQEHIQLVIISYSLGYSGNDLGLLFLMDLDFFLRLAW